MNEKEDLSNKMKKIKKRIALCITALFVGVGGYQCGKQITSDRDVNKNNDTKIEFSDDTHDYDNSDDNRNDNSVQNDQNDVNDNINDNDEQISHNDDNVQTAEKNKKTDKKASEKGNSSSKDKGKEQKKNKQDNSSEKDKQNDKNKNDQNNNSEKDNQNDQDKSDNENKPHQHNFNEFVGFEGDKENWECTCGEQTQKDHKLGKKEYDDANKEIVQECETDGCDYEIRISHPQHQFTFKNFDAEKETLECDECGEIQTKQHQLGAQTMDRTTHEVVQECENPDCSYEKREKHTPHNFNTLIKYDANQEYYECECGEQTQKAHKLSEKTYDKDKKEFIQECENPDCDYQKVEPHNLHIYDVFVSYTEAEETLKCVCGEITTRTHNLGEKYFDAAKLEIVQECENEDCDYEKRISHPNHNYELFTYDASLETLLCDECGETQNRNHQLGSERMDRITHEVVQECENPNCDYEKRTPHAPHNFDTFVTFDDEKETLECTDCGAQTERAHHLAEPTFDKVTHEVVQECDNVGCDYEKREEHNPHTYDTFKRYEDETEYWDCVCGEEVTKGHDLGDEYIDVEGKTFDRVRECETEGCDYEVRVLHSTEHSYKINLDLTDEENEYWECICGDYYTQGHNFNEGVLQPDRTYLQECQNEGCNQTRSYHTCIEGNAEYVYIGTKDECYKRVWHCEICDKALREEKPVGHNLWEDWDSNVYRCSNGSCSYTEPLEEYEPYSNDEEIIAPVSQSIEEKSKPVVMEIKQEEHPIKNDAKDEPKEVATNDIKIEEDTTKLELEEETEEIVEIANIEEPKEKVKVLQYSYNY